MKEIDFDKTKEFFNFNALLNKSIRIKNQNKLDNTNWKYINVIFHENGMSYTYKTNLNCKIGNIVDAPTCNYTLYQQAMIVDIIKNRKWKPKVPEDKILVVSKIIAEEDLTGHFNRIGFIKRNTDQELIKEWRLDEKGEYGENYISTFGMEIFFEFGDDYIECYIEGEEIKDDDYEIYNVDPKIDLETQVKYLETILSKLHYNIITKKEFEKLLDLL